MHPDGITERSIISPIAIPRPGFRRIIKINNFPAIYSPKNLGKPRVLDFSKYFRPFPVERCEYYFREL